MAQGAAMAIEDADVLSRCLGGAATEGVANALKRFEATRKPRTTRVQLTSRQNTWLSSRTDGAWLYGYNAWEAPLAVEDPV
jgi:6-hydroxynicotinate 3-monooxygenase